jgi:hypothetical protein
MYISLFAGENANLAEQRLDTAICRIYLTNKHSCSKNIVQKCSMKRIYQPTECPFDQTSITTVLYSHTYIPVYVHITFL